MAKKKKEMSVEQEEKQRASNRQSMVKMREEGTEPPDEDNLDPKIGHNEWVTVRTGPFQLALYF